MITTQTLARLVRLVIVMCIALVISATTVLAQRGRGEVRSSSAQSVNRDNDRNVNQNANVNRNANVNQNTNVNRNTNVNQNVNVNRNIDVDRDVDVDVDHHYGGYGGCCYSSGWGTAAAVATTAVVTAAVVGSIHNSLPPSCSMVIVGGLSYQQCGSTWYQPQISGNSTTYVVVSPPR